MALDTLPGELRQMILKLCARSALVNLSVCSKFWKAEVVPILWNEVSIKWEDLDASDVERTTRNLKYTEFLILEGSPLKYELSALNQIYNFVLLLHNCNPDQLGMLEIKNYMIPDGLKVLSNMLPNLNTLVITSIDGSAGFDYVPCFKELDEVAIDKCSISDDQVKKICELEKLNILELRSCIVLTDLSLEYISKVTQLKELTFNHDGSITTDKFNATLPKLTNLVYLEIWNAPIDDEFFQLAGKNFDSLETLNVKESIITNLGLEKIFKLRYLKELVISKCKSISDDGLAHELTNLVDLNISDTNISDAGLQHVSKLISLTSLDISLCEEVTDAGMTFIAQLRNLQSLCIDFIDLLTDDGFEKIGSLQILRKLSMCGWM